MLAVAFERPPAPSRGKRPAAAAPAPEPAHAAVPRTLPRAGELCLMPAHYSLAPPLIPPADASDVGQWNASRTDPPLL